MVAALVSLAGCGESGVDPEVGKRSAEAVSTSTTLPGTSDAVATTSVATLTPPLPCPASANYTTLPDWTLDDLPDGLVASYSNTSVHDDPLPGPDPVPYQFVMAAGSSDRLDAVVMIVRDAPPLGTSGAPESDRSSIEGVRGHKGSIVKWMTRSGPPYSSIAVWNEKGTQWRSTSALEPAELGKTLTSLTLSHDDVSDTTSRFALIGEGPVESGEPVRQTVVSVGDSSSSQDSLIVTIRSVPNGTTGLVDGPWAWLGSAMADNSGRIVTVNDRVMAQVPGQVSTSTTDGSQIEVRAINTEQTIPPETLAAIASRVRPTTEADAGVVPYLPPGNPASEVICSE